MYIYISIRNTSNLNL